MPLIGAAFGGDHHRSAHRPACVGVLLRSLHGEFLNRVWREILQEATDIIVRIVAAVDREHVIQSGAAAEGHRRDARLGWVGRLHRHCPRHQIRDVGKTAVSQRNRLQIPRRHNASMHGTSAIDWLGDYGRGLRLHLQFLLCRGRFERHTDYARGTDGDADCGSGLGEARSPHGHRIGTRHQIIEAELSAAIALGLALQWRLGGLQADVRGLDSASTRIRYGSRHTASEILGARNPRHEAKRQDNSERNRPRRRLSDVTEMPQMTWLHSLPPSDRLNAPIAKRL